LYTIRIEGSRDGHGGGSVGGRGRGRKVTWRNPRRYHEDHILAADHDVEDRGQQLPEEFVRVTLVPYQQVHEQRVPYRGGRDPSSENNARQIRTEKLDQRFVVNQTSDPYPGPEMTEIYS